MKRLSVFLYGLMLSVLCNAGNIEQTLLTLNQARTSYVADFTERIVMPKVHKEIVKKGRMYYCSNESLLMQYTDPQGDYSLIRNGKFSASRKGHTTDFAMNEERPSQMYILRETLLGSLSGNLQRVAKRNNAGISCSETADTYVCTLKKESAKALDVNALELIYDKPTGLLLSLKLIQQNGNYTVYEVSNGEADVAVPDAVWQQ